MRTVHPPQPVPPMLLRRSRRTAPLAGYRTSKGRQRSAMTLCFQLAQPHPSQTLAQGGSKPLTPTSAAHLGIHTAPGSQLLHPRIHQSCRDRDDLREHHHVPY
ncbi:hypothetical protein [Streptomyces sp. NBC_00696]|uniref:hypothetical protein n=1 Tax=Streptomyces sp. NBC_00696 TaxID=2903672 RepID=UPI002E36F0AD|nr:hypothetical protein [Streptomyces sp. NBC_00696]